MAYAPGVEVPRQVEAERVPVPSAGGSGSKVCRMHGAAGGAPEGNRNALKHGLFTAKAIDVRRIVRELRRQAHDFAEMS